jgi:hypothetical protein
MKIKIIFCLIAAASLALSGLALAQTNEMTGTVLGVTSTKITVQKGSEVWEIKRSRDTSVTGNLKIGSTVTVKYSGPDAQKKENPATAPSPAPAEQ